MKIEAKTIKWFDELEADMNAMKKALRHSVWEYDTIDWQKWTTSARAAIQSVFGKDSPHDLNFSEAYQKCRGYKEEIDALQGIFLAAKRDVLGGYVFNAEKIISGELFGDFVVMAKSALDQGHKDVAAVLACAALEDALKRYARLNELDIDDKDMQSVVNALKSKGLVTGAQKSLLDSMPKIRDYAMHANWVKIKPEDVAAVIGFVEHFLMNNFN